LALLENKYERARRHFRRALEIAPGYSAAQRYLIAADELLGNTLEAAANAEELLSRNPNFSRVLYFQTGMLQFRNGNYDRALELFALFKERQDQPIANFGILGETEQRRKKNF
jgi:tetratricopeptide (TPR) repeat protein